jgi:cell wall-associated NlpC family hydrolase
MSDCSDLIGLQYALGADGENGQIDCIHLVYIVMSRLGVETPAFDSSWYVAPKKRILRDLLTWGRRIQIAEYDGDVVLFHQGTQAFGVTWSTGILYISSQTKRVNWGHLSVFTNYHCFRSRKI